MTDPATRIKEIREEIGSSKETRLRLEGRKTELESQLLKEHKLGSVEAANTHLEDLDKEIAALDTEVATGLKTLEQEHGFAN